MPATNSPRKINLARRFANAPSYSPLKVARPVNESVRALRIAIQNAIASTEQTIVLAADPGDQALKVSDRARVSHSHVSLH